MKSPGISGAHVFEMTMFIYCRIIFRKTLEKSSLMICRRKNNGSITTRRREVIVAALSVKELLAVVECFLALLMDDIRLRRHMVSVKHRLSEEDVMLLFRAN